MRLIVVFLLINVFSSSFSQGYIEEKLKLKKKWPEAEAVITNYQVTVTFELDELSQQPIALQKEIIDIVPTKVLNIERMYFVHNHSKINYAKCKMNGKRRQSMAVVNGDWESEGIFHSDQKFVHYEIPTYKAGGHYRFEIEKQYNDIRYLTRLMFTDMIYPVENFRAEVNIPSWLDMQLAPFNFEFYNVIESKDSNSEVSKYFFEIENIDVSKKDDHYLSEVHSAAHILFLPKSYHTDQHHDIFKDLQSFYNFYQSLVGEQNTDTTLIQPVLNKILDGAENGQDSIRQIYYWVQDNIRYLAFEDGIAGFRPERADVVLSNKYGDCKGMANLLKNMLVMSGFDARLAWLGTKHLIYDYTYQSLGVDNHMICYLNYQDKHFYLDATNKNLKLGINAGHIQGKQVLIEDGDNYLLKVIPKSKAHDNLIISEANVLMNNSVLKGNLQMTFNGTPAYNIKALLESYQQSEREKTIKKVLKQNHSCQIDSIQMDDIENREDSWQLSCYIEVNDKIHMFEEDMYVNLDFLLEPKVFEKDTLKRNHIYNGYHYGVDATVNLLLPGPTVMNYKPDSISYDEKDCMLSADYVLNENELVYHKKMLVESSLFRKEDFKSYVEFVETYKKVQDLNVELHLIKP